MITLYIMADKWLIGKRCVHQAVLAIWARSCLSGGSAKTQPKSAPEAWHIAKTLCKNLKC